MLLKELIWLKYMLTKFWLLKDINSINLLCDNQSSITLVYSHVFHSKTKIIKMQ
jgi:hypothetical protein